MPFQRMIASLAIALAAPALAAAIPADEAGFTDFVAARLRQQVGNGQVVTVKGPLTLGVGALQANLDRVFGFCRNSAAAACEEEIDRYARGVAQVARDMNAPPTREAVRLVVRPADYARQLKPVQGQAPTSWPLGGDLVILPVLDMPQTMRSLSAADLKTLGLDADQVAELGRANLARTLKPLMQQAKVAGHGQIGQLTGDPYESSRLALHDAWAPLAAAQGGVLIVAAPAKDAVFYVGEDTPQAIDALRTLAGKVMAQAPSPLSRALLRWTADGWTPVR